MSATAIIETPAESAYRRIRADILLGRLPPGRKLKLDHLRGDYSASVSTLRETLSRLSSEKLVVAEGQRGFEVAPISVKNLKEIAALRQLLEGHALGQSFDRGDVEWDARVVASHHKLALIEERMEAGHRSATELWKQYDWQFHQALISACGSRLLIETHAAVFDQYLRYQMIALGFRSEISAREHRVLLECALQRDAVKARQTLSAHISGGVEHALAAGIIKSPV
jgi:DNA-binding GntR family transcriptional regulator